VKTLDLPVVLALPESQRELQTALVYPEAAGLIKIWSY
jgi:hypothetical protein